MKNKNIKNYILHMIFIYWFLVVIGNCYSEVIFVNNTSCRDIELHIREEKGHGVYSNSYIPFIPVEIKRQYTCSSSGEEENEDLWSGDSEAEEEPERIKRRTPKEIQRRFSERFEKITEEFSDLEEELDIGSLHFSFNPQKFEIREISHIENCASFPTANSIVKISIIFQRKHSFTLDNAKKILRDNYTYRIFTILDSEEFYLKLKAFDNFGAEKPEYDINLRKKILR